MGDMKEVFDLMKERNKERKAKNLASANPDGWTKHTEYHWSRKLHGKRLDYWPSRNKFQYDGKVMCGDVNAFIRNRLSEGKPA
jgi:hypothetical protein